MYNNLVIMITAGASEVVMGVLYHTAQLQARVALALMFCYM